jgi:hypothetical protein
MRRIHSARAERATVRSRGAVGAAKTNASLHCFRVLCLPMASCRQFTRAATSVHRRFLGSSRSKPLACLLLLSWGCRIRSAIGGRDLNCESRQKWRKEAKSFRSAAAPPFHFARATQLKQDLHSVRPLFAPSVSCRHLAGREDESSCSKHTPSLFDPLRRLGSAPNYEARRP